jgi:hypothetical protein
LGDLVGDGDAPVSHVLKTLEIIHLLLDLLGLCGRDALAGLLAFMKVLKDEVRALGTICSGLFFGVKLPAQGAAAEAVDGLKLGQERLALGGQLLDFVWHGDVVSIQIQQCKQKRAL